MKEKGVLSFEEGVANFKSFVPLFVIRKMTILGLCHKIFYKRANLVPGCTDQLFG